MYIEHVADATGPTRNILDSTLKIQLLICASISFYFRSRLSLQTKIQLYEFRLKFNLRLTCKTYIPSAPEIIERLERLSMTLRQTANGKNETLSLTLKMRHFNTLFLNCFCSITKTKTLMFTVQCISFLKFLLFYSKMYIYEKED